MTKVVSDMFKCLSSTHLDLNHLDRRRSNGRVICIWHFYVFAFNESPAGESFSQPATSIKTKEDSTVTSVSRPVSIFTPSSTANKTLLVECALPRLVGESGVTGI